MPRVALVVAVLALAGCGGDDGGGGATDGGGTAGASDGERLFAGTCGGCHALSDAGTTGTFGPDLDDLKPDEARVLAAIENGPGSMPENLFEGAQAQTVAAYVASAAGS